jgi:hypothetical protein
VINALWGGGSCGAFSVGTPGLNGRYIDGTTEPGVIPYTNATGGKQKYLLNLGGKISLNTTGARGACVYDLIWINSGIVVTTTTLQSFAPGALPNRDENGSNLGHGLEAGLIVTSVLGTGGQETATYNYTNQDGVQRTNVSLVINLDNLYTVGSLIPLALYPGDTGVRSIDGITLNTTLVSGSISAVLYRKLVIGADLSGSGVVYSWNDIGLPKLYDGSAVVPALACLGSGGLDYFMSVDLTVGEV